jgi:hypothetical protein
MYVVYIERDNAEYYVSLHSTLAGALTHIKNADASGAIGEGAPASPTDPTNWPDYFAEFRDYVRVFRVNADDDKPSKQINWAWHLGREAA